MEIVTLLPIINLLADLFTSNPEPVTTGGLVYDVMQLLAGLLVLSKFGAWVATWTETKKDDQFWAKVAHYIGKATDWLARVASAQGEPGKPQTRSRRR